MPQPSPTTRSDWAEERLRGAILRGELEPGERLRANDLAERWDVSATPLREAFQRLAADGLVEVLPQRGARVTALDLSDAQQIYELRLLLEPLCLRRSLASSDDEHRRTIAERFEAFRTAPTPEDALDAHTALHAALLERCPSPWLLRFTTQLADASRLFQVASAGGGRVRRHPVREHKAIVDAALRGEVERCAALQEEHLRRTLELLGAGPPT